MMELIKHAAVNEPLLQDLLVLEHETYAHLLRLCGKDLEKVKPESFIITCTYFMAVADKDIMKAYNQRHFQPL